MASKLILDRTDPDVDAMVSAWKNGERYRVALEIDQASSDPKQAVFDVAEVSNETAEPEEEPAAEYPAAPAKAKAAKPTIVIK